VSGNQGPRGPQGPQGEFDAATLADVLLRIGALQTTLATCCGTTEPSQPRNVVATGAGVGVVSVSFDTPVSDGGTPLTAYHVESTPDGLGPTTASGAPSESPVLVTGLTPGRAYTFAVTAANAVHGHGVPGVSSAVLAPLA
jgi:hypothetical protein